MSGASEYAGKSILDGLVSAPAPVATPERENALLLELDGGGSVVVEHDGPPTEAPTERRWGQEWVAFADGNRVRADRILRYRAVSAAEAAAEAARPQEAVPVYLAGVQQAPAAAAGTSLEDLPYSMWPLEALVDEERELVAKCNPQGGTENASSDLTEVREALAKKREGK